MIPAAVLADRLRQVFAPTPRGVAGLVDDLTALGREQPLRFDHRDGRCVVRPVGSGASEAFDIPLPKSVFRAALARVAAACNERAPGSVTPYGGAGEMVVASDPPAVVGVSFANTPDEQWLEFLAPVSPAAGNHPAPFGDRVLH